MPHRFRFYVPPDQFAPGTIALSPEEAHHAVHVARLRVGDPVETTDGRGRIGGGTVRHTDRRRVELELETVRHDPPPDQTITLAVAYPNREKTLERIVESCVPLGVTSFLVFSGEHSERQAIPRERWERWVRETCKQCMRSWFPTIGTAGDLGEALEQVTGARFLAAIPGCGTVTIPADVVCAPQNACIVGPEGGFSDSEYRMLESWPVERIDLGPAVLRTELACATLVALLAYEQRAKSEIDRGSGGVRTPNG